PLPAVATRYPSADRAQVRMSWIAGSSSTTRIDAVIAEITFELADRSPGAARTAGCWRTRSARRGSRRSLCAPAKLRSGATLPQYQLATYFWNKLGLAFSRLRIFAPTPSHI